MLGLSRKDGETITLIVPPGFSGPIVVAVRRQGEGIKVGIDAPKAVRIYRTEKMAEWGVDLPISRKESEA